MGLLILWSSRPRLPPQSGLRTGTKSCARHRTTTRDKDTPTASTQICGIFYVERMKRYSDHGCPEGRKPTGFINGALVFALLVTRLQRECSAGVKMQWLVLRGYLEYKNNNARFAVCPSYSVLSHNESSLEVDQMQCCDIRDLPRLSLAYDDVIIIMNMRIMSLQTFIKGGI